jgi:hypothetical protein
VEFNEKLVFEGISKKKDYIENMKAVSGKKFDILNSKIEIEEHVLKSLKLHEYSTK